jgi:hypothetical protein
MLKERLQKTSRCRDEVQQTAACFSGLGIEAYEALIRQLVDLGEDQALGILLNVCAINAIRLSPELLAETLGVVEPLADFAAPFRLQDQSSIAPLLSMAAASNISWQRQAFAARLAMELTLRFAQDPKPVKKVLTKLAQLDLSIENRLFNAESLALLESKEIGADFPRLTQSDPLDTLPKKKPPVVIGGDYSVRRPIPRIGRNDPCPCGSGKKYKKCCIEKDQEIIRDAAPYAGLTMTALKSSPGAVDDTRWIEGMRAYELKKLVPSALGSRQLFAAFRRCDLFGLYDLALAMLIELQGRPDFDLDPGHFYDLLTSALMAKDLASARRIRPHVPDDQLLDPEQIEFNFALLENPSWLKPLEARCRKALTGAHDGWDDPLVATAYDLEKIYPALSIVLSRAAMMGPRENRFDQEGLLDAIHSARIELELDPFEDPAEEYLELLLDKKEADLASDQRSKEIDDLKDKVSQARQLATQRLKELGKKEQALTELTTRLRKKEEMPAIGSRPAQVPSPAPPSEPQTISRLRQRIETLKLDISKGQQERRDLRKQVEQALEKADHGDQSVQDPTDADEVEQAMAADDVPKTILIPEFSDEYRDSCRRMHGSVVMKSLKTAAGFAAHDRIVWRHTKALSSLPSIYSIRVGIHHRLLIRWEKEIRLEVLDLIQREQLDTWIKGFRRRG